MARSLDSEWVLLGEDGNESSSPPSPFNGCHESFPSGGDVECSPAPFVDNTSLSPAAIERTSEVHPLVERNLTSAAVLLVKPKKTVPGMVPDDLPAASKPLPAVPAAVPTAAAEEEEAAAVVGADVAPEDGNCHPIGLEAAGMVPDSPAADVAPALLDVTEDVQNATVQSVADGAVLDAPVFAGAVPGTAAPPAVTVNPAESKAVPTPAAKAETPRFLDHELKRDINKWLQENPTWRSQLYVPGECHLAAAVTKGPAEEVAGEKASMPQRQMVDSDWPAKKEEGEEEEEEVELAAAPKPAEVRQLAGAQTNGTATSTRSAAATTTSAAQAVLGMLPRVPPRLLAAAHEIATRKIYSRFASWHVLVGALLLLIAVLLGTTRPLAPSRQLSRLQGTRKIEYAAGGVYEGEVLDGLPHGVGKYTWPGGSPSYEGRWAAGRFHGKGTFWGPGGETYEGEWAAGRRHGCGAYVAPGDGPGQGEEHVLGGPAAPGGERYKGEWAGGARHGEGKLWAANGCHYSGEFQNGERAGTGVYFWPEGTVTYVHTPEGHEKAADWWESGGPPSLDAWVARARSKLSAAAGAAARQLSAAQEAVAASAAHAEAWRRNVTRVASEEASGVAAGWSAAWAAGSKTFAAADIVVRMKALLVRHELQTHSAAAMAKSLLQKGRAALLVQRDLQAAVTERAAAMARSLLQKGRAAWEEAAKGGVTGGLWAGGRRAAARAAETAGKAWAARTSFNVSSILAAAAAAAPRAAAARLCQQAQQLVARAAEGVGRIAF